VLETAGKPLRPGRSIRKTRCCTGPPSWPRGSPVGENRQPKTVGKSECSDRQCSLCRRPLADKNSGAGPLRSAAIALGLCASAIWRPAKGLGRESFYPAPISAHLFFSSAFFGRGPKMPSRFGAAHLNCPRRTDAARRESTLYRGLIFGGTNPKGITWRCTGRKNRLGHRSPSYAAHAVDPFEIIECLAASAGNRARAACRQWRLGPSAGGSQFSRRQDLSARNRSSCHVSAP